MSEAGATCRIDVWLWRARFFKTRSFAARVVSDGGVRLMRGGARVALDKPARTVRSGDVIVFPVGETWRTVAILGLGLRRGPAREAHELYRVIETA